MQTRLVWRRTQRQIDVMSDVFSPKANTPSGAGSAPGEPTTTGDETARGHRLVEEFQRVDSVLRDMRIMSTVVVFGSSRVQSASVRTQETPSIRPANTSSGPAWYEMARKFAKLVSQRGGAIGPPGSPLYNVIATGGGPGLMEAANRGACDAGAPSIGFNIVLPVAQPSNPYTTPELTFRFHYFAMRKMHLAMRANALAVFPGGFGTLDELFELLTLKQTGKGQAIPILLFDRSYWRNVVNFEALAAEDMISPQDLSLFDFADSEEEAWDTLLKRGLRAGPPAQR
jgi:uncharacterized protein (TIGR00730 family)